jgi:Mor family transcriptional regulator
MANAPEAREQLLARMVEVIREETGLHERFARPMAEGILRRLGDEFRGERVYLGEDRETVYQQAIAEFNGRNRDAVCAKYGMSRATFYRVPQCRRCGAIVTSVSERVSTDCGVRRFHSGESLSFGCF